MAAVTPSGAQDVPLSLFSSLDTELSPSDIPEGISPDNQNVVYKPGSVSTRPAYQRVFTTELDGGAINYQKSYVMPNGNIKNLYLTSLGNLWVEDVTNLPGVATLLFQTTATQASSVTAFGREYIALSDGVTGQDIPVQYDGTNLWRVTQDGPGAPPKVASIALSPSTLSSSTGVVLTLGTVNAATFDTYYTNPTNCSIFPYQWVFDNSGNVVGRSTLFIALSAPLTQTVNGQTIVITGATNYNGTYVVTDGLIGSISLTVNQYTAGLVPATGTGGIATIAPATLTRGNNVVTGQTSTAHGLKVGYQVQITDVPASPVGGGIVSIVIDNENQPGIATVTTTNDHGLVPNCSVTIADIPDTTVGTAITNIAFAGDQVTVTTSTAHTLSIGSQVLIAAVTNRTVNGQWSVNSIPTPTTFTYIFVSSVTAYSAADTGTVSYKWPLASVNPDQNFFTVQTCPTSTKFTVGLSYTDGTWTAGVGSSCSFAWDGIFYVTDVLDSMTFSYQQYGPNSTNNAAGTVTPYGQATPGIHQCQLLFQLESGAITAPSPPVSFVANGGQYVSVTNIATGPSNVVSRILQFTGAGGAYYFYIPVPAQVNGQIVSTATQINDNTTTSVVLDFSDNTLYSALATSIPGNNLRQQVVLGPCAGFFAYASRLTAWGERNKVQNFVNMGFEGGALPSAPTYPSGWTVGDTRGALVPSRLGSAWQITVPNSLRQSLRQAGTISQSAYADTYGTPILLANTLYKIRLWASVSDTGVGTNIFATLTSALTGFSATATVVNGSVTSGGNFVEATFSANMPASIPTDLLFTIYAENVMFPGVNIVTIEEVELIYAHQPYLQSQSKMSYVDNPEGFDALTGIIGPSDDQSAIMNFGVIRSTLYMVTGNSLHKTNDVSATEPANWDVEHVADNCGAWSIDAIARNPQGIGSAGKEWMTWSGQDGAQIFTGQQPMKISQEIQSLWDSIYQAGVSRCWTKNDQTAKRCYYGIPISADTMQILVLDYRNLDGESIAGSPPVHISFTGKMIASDLTRKWAKWTGNMQCAELMYRGGAAPVMCFGSGVAGANSYTLNAAKYTDDDFGQIASYYTTYFFVSHEMEQALQVGSHRKLYQFLSAYISGVGTYTVQLLAASLSNVVFTTAPIALGPDPQFDFEMGINAETTRCAFKIIPAPLTGQTDAAFSLQKLVVNMKKSPWAPVRGSNTGAF